MTAVFQDGADLEEELASKTNVMCTKAKMWNLCHRLDKAHPTVAQGKVTRKVCFNWSRGCCSWSNNIEVVNCELFYVYKLSRPPHCSLRYCGSDN